MKKFLRKTLKSFAYLCGFILLFIGGCESFKYIGARPVREICASLPVGHTFNAGEFSREINNHKIIGSISRETDKPQNISLNSKEAAQEIADIDMNKLPGHASATIAVGFPKYSCKLSFANGQILTNKSYWWD